MEQQFCLFVLTVILVLLSSDIHHVVCDTYYILTSPSSSCPGELPGEPCLTLQQFANSPGSSSSVLLMMESGSHTLNTAISLSNIYNFTMASLVPKSDVRIICSTQSNVSGSFLLTSVSFVQLQGVSIEGCTYSTFGTNGDSVLINAVSFSNLRDGGMLIRNISNRVQLNNVTFTNSDITEIDTIPTTMIQMRDVVFISGRSISVGPAAELSIEDSTFQGGSASALYLYNITRGTVVRCRFHSNNRYEECGGNLNGGALSVLYSASVTINESIFYANSAGESGGDIYGNSSNITIDRSTFTGSSVSGVFTYKVNLTVMNSNFSDSRAISGAAINAVRSQRLQIIACTFTNNDATNVYDDIWFGNGGALRMYLCTTVLISNSHFINNSAVYAGAILCHDGGSFTVTDCSFSSNVASHDEGGAMRVYASHLTLFRSVFDNNSASTKGGAVYVTGTVTANWSNFTNNRADNGGALYVYAVSTQLSVSHGYFKNNTASNGSGGAIFNDGQTDTNVSLVDSTFEYNSAASCGVLSIDIYIFHSILNLIGSTFSYNMAMGQSVGGGVVCVKDASISVINSTFSHNSAALHAGVMYVDDSVLKVERSLFISNLAKDNGGVMYTNTSSTNYTINLSSFVNNTAGDSGGMMFIGRALSWVSMERSSCGHNSAVNRGGVVAIYGSNLVINETNVFNNTARFGGAVSACNSDVTVPSELAGTEDSADSECILYNGYIDHFNFIHQEVSTTSSMPVTLTTTASSTTKNSLSTTTQTESTTTGRIPSTNSLVTTTGSHTASATTSSGVSQPTTTNGLTNTSTQTESPTTDSTPNTPYTSISMTTTGSKDASPTTSSENTSRSMTDSLKINIIIAISCISVIIILCLCVLIGVYVTIKIIGKLKRRRSGYSLHNDNEFLMQEAE